MALAALSLVLTPAIAAQSQQQKKAPSARSASLRSGNFTPAVADPRLAAELARRGLQPGSFRFTPAAASSNKSKAIRVAVRARAATPAEALRRDSSASAVTAITPSAYNLGVAIGWKGFALSGDVAKIEGGPLPGSREAAEVGVSYAGRKFTGRLDLGADRTNDARLKSITDQGGYSVGVGGSYRITRNLDVTGGVRYRIQNDRLQPLADERRDSQAVYIGTAFRF